MKLVNFLKKLRNEQVTIELKNGTTVWGTLQTVSPQMNATLTDVKLSLPRSVSNSSTLASIHLSEGTPIPNETSTSLQYINIRGSTIRQIILPDSLNIDSLLVDERELNRLRRAGKVSNDPSKKRSGEFGENSNKRIRRGV
ncbi:BN860_10154g1_1 [Zygosaccharomyces bailii CLIB 213]|uniref:BN860_10154g1_1 n=1 Tax=Zygosaccharomyces bailii (strain CLIB 213 / ATCC 58445 / CBS 680 / BCRC 21525 / NBRC 1098 / NCYC 1416 / NRRL Y-2227) TaxID=1333698 RepID=A0A8J2T2T9_ZYGB2|nr:BN860_10154g1_1 [Zygosaccharomyces bailii CLIB 213]